MIKPLTQRQQDSIVRNIIFATRDIRLLKKTGYKYIYLCSGFIAHYDLHGFIAYYQDHSLREDILANSRANMWFNFAPEDENYAYYQSKAAVYKRILEGIKAWDDLDLKRALKGELTVEYYTE
jgi:hypothetical protein